MGPATEANMKTGDVSRRRRVADPARQRWYALHRCARFARRMGCLAATLAPAEWAALRVRRRPIA
jgi:hypothetical protein